MTDVLLAYPLVGPNLARFVRLIRSLSRDHVPRDRRRTRIGRGPVASGPRLDQPIPVLIDLEVGMGRTGIDPGEAAVALYEQHRRSCRTWPPTACTPMTATSTIRTSKTGPERPVGSRR